MTRTNDAGCVEKAGEYQAAKTVKGGYRSKAYIVCDCVAKCE